MIMEDHWRWTLETDSKTEAEVRCRRSSVESDAIIQQVRDGSFRHVSEEDIEDLAMNWSMDFQQTSRENIARDMFPDVFPSQPRIGEEAAVTE